MKILLDHCLDWRLRRLLPAHEVKATFEMGWASLEDGDLLTTAEAQFEVFVTADQNIQFQQSLQGRSLAVIILITRTNRLQDTAPLMPPLEALLPTIQPGRFYQLTV